MPLRQEAAPLLRSESAHKNGNAQMPTALNSGVALMRQSLARNRSHQGRTVFLVNCDLKRCDFSSFIDK
jgi:hypothetical protein